MSAPCAKIVSFESQLINGEIAISVRCWGQEVI